MTATPKNERTFIYAGREYIGDPDAIFNFKRKTMTKEQKNMLLDNEEMLCLMNDSFSDMAVIRETLSMIIEKITDVCGMISLVKGNLEIIQTEKERNEK